MDLISSKSIKQLIKKRWVIVISALILTGLGAALAGVLFKNGVHILDDWRLKLLKEFPPWLVLPIMGGMGGIISGLLIKHIAPSASGSGVSHIMAFLRHKPVPMGLKVGLTKLIAGIVAIGSGFPLGPEGPAVQMGGSVAWQMAKWLKAPIAFRRVIVAAGGGAGIAAIFSAPIGGFVYAIEELLNSARPVVLLLVVVTTFWADTWADVLQSLGLYSNTVGFDSNLGFQLEKQYSTNIQFLPIDLSYLIILGIITSLLAELYCRYVLNMQKQGLILFGKSIVSKMAICGIVLGFMYAFLPETFHNLGELQKSIALGNVNIVTAINTFLILFISTGLAAASGAPGGLFYPMLTLGGSVGLCCGIFFESFTGHIPTSIIFAGMGGFVASCSRTPITAMFLAFALTKDLLILKPILITCVVSFLTSQIFSEDSIYERQIKMESNRQKYISEKTISKRYFLKSILKRFQRNTFTTPPKEN